MNEQLTGSVCILSRAMNLDAISGEEDQEFTLFHAVVAGLAAFAFAAIYLI